MNPAVRNSLVGLALILAGCGQGNQVVAPYRPPVAQPLRTNLLTSAEISSFSNAYDAVRSLRQKWLVGREASGTGPAVFIDGILAPGVEVLVHMHPGRIADMSYLSASETTVRYGPINSGGAILVRTSRR